MNMGNSIKAMRISCMQSQSEFAKELGVSFSTVNRWEGNKVKPNYAAMKKINEYCQRHNIAFDVTKFVLEE